MYISFMNIEMCMYVCICKLALYVAPSAGSPFMCEQATGIVGGVYLYLCIHECMCICI